MIHVRRRVLAALLAAGAVSGGALAVADSPSGARLTAVPSSEPKVTGSAAPNVLSAELRESPVAQGSSRLENATARNPFYGYLGDGPMLPAPGDAPTAQHAIEAMKTEPDKNTYLNIDGQGGADASYDYGTHFLCQGHENGSPGMITRINLDADGQHRVTLMASEDAGGNDLATIDGSTWDPFAHRLLFTTEGTTKPEYQATIAFPSKVEDISGAIGRGGYEGIQNDSAGNLWILEDVGGKAGTSNPNAKQANSFLYRFRPEDPSDLTQGGELQALQVRSLQTGTPIVFHPGEADRDILSPDEKDLHTYANTFKTRWVTVHTAGAHAAPFDANAAAKAANATPFKRPENGVFRPGTRFREFYFSETGDTNQNTEAGSAYGGFGGAFRLTQSNPSADDSTLTLLYRGDVAHTGFDNVQFLDRDHVTFVEDAGDTLHTQRNAFDSGYVFDVTRSYAHTQAQPVRWLALGRDASATVDSQLSGATGLKNDGDNEITGIHVSDGDPSTHGILGAKVPKLFKHGWREFYTQQHGDNVTWEVLRARR